MSGKRPDSFGKEMREGKGGVVVRAWVLQGWWYVHGSYRCCGTCMASTGVVVCAWVLQGLWYVHVSYRGCGTCMGPTGVVVRVWVLQGSWYVHGSYRVVVRVWVLQPLSPNVDGQSMHRPSW